MSKWEDTVMSVSQCEKAWQEAEKYWNLGCHDWTKKQAIAEAQAEISFKAGYKQAGEEMNLQSTSLADLCLEHRKAGYEQSVLDNDNWARQDYGYQLGVREVVEYLDKHKGAMVRLVSNGGETIKTTFEINSSEWQAKLKEWGLKEDGTSG